MRPALALLALAVPAACFVAPQRRLAARPLFAEEKADFDPNAKVSQLDEVLIQWGKDDPRIPEECRVDPMTRIKEAGKAGVAAYTLTEFAFWLGACRWPSRSSRTRQEVFGLRHDGRQGGRK